MTHSVSKLKKMIVVMRFYLFQIRTKGTPTIEIQFTTRSLMEVVKRSSITYFKLTSQILSLKKC